MSDDNGLVSGILELGEERMGEVVNQLLANERFAGALQNAVTGSLTAKRSVDRSLSRLYSLANVPTLEDMEQVRAKLEEVEALLGEAQKRVDVLARRAKKKKKSTRPGEKKGVETVPKAPKKTKTKKKS